MHVLVNFPTVGADEFDPVYADQVIDQTKADGFRVVLERHAPGRNAQILTYLDENDLMGVPILSCDEPDTTPENLARFAEGIRYPERCPFVEIGNEPITNRKPPLTAQAYADIVNAVAPVLNSQGQLVALACDAMRPNGWRHPRWVRWWEAVTANVTSYWDVAAIHPYRAGAPSLTRTHWPDIAHRCPWLGRAFWGAQRRSEEVREWCRLAGLKTLAVTEVGWSRDRGTDAEVEAWMLEELLVHNSYDVPVVCVYAHHGPFGVLEDDRTLAPQGRAIRRFQEVIK